MKCSPEGSIGDLGAMFEGQRVGVVIPTYNEARLLPVTLRGLPEFVDEVIVVDDGSRDESAAVAQQVAVTAPWRLELAMHQENRGVGGAICTGYQRALTLNCALVVVVGADAQMDPSEMGALLTRLRKQGVDYVKGDRFAHPEASKRIPWLRRVGNQLLSAATRRLTGDPTLSDAQCGYTAIRGETLQRLPLSALYPRYGFPNDLLIRLAEIDARVEQVPVTPIYGEERSKLSIPKVIIPLSLLLLRAALRRPWRHRARAARS